MSKVLVEISFPGSETRESLLDLENAIRNVVEDWRVYTAGRAAGEVSTRMSVYINDDDGEIK